MVIFSSCLDLRRYENDAETKRIFMKVLTGKDNFVEPPKCKQCNAVLKGHEKFCPECGAKTEQL